MSNNLGLPGFNEDTSGDKEDTSGNEDTLRDEENTFDNEVTSNNEENVSGNNEEDNSSDEGDNSGNEDDDSSNKGIPGLEVCWTVERDEVYPGVGKCCSTSSCHAPDSDLNAGQLTKMDNAAAQSHHHLILEVLKSDTSTSNAILGPSPGGRCWMLSGGKGQLFCSSGEVAQQSLGVSMVSAQLM